MALSAIALASRALLKLGAGTVASFDEGTAEAEIAGNLYPSLRDALLSAHPWSFATAQAKLAKLAAEPVADYAHAYQLPADFLRALSAGPSGRGRGIDYRIAERRLHADAGDVVLTYIFRPDELDFPPFFDQALIARLAADEKPQAPGDNGTEKPGPNEKPDGPDTNQRPEPNQVEPSWGERIFGPPSRLLDGLRKPKPFPKTGPGVGGTRW